jgi:hypothetical protein
VQLVHLRFTFIYDGELPTRGIVPLACATAAKSIIHLHSAPDRRQKPPPPASGSGRSVNVSEETRQGLFFLVPAVGSLQNAKKVTPHTA